MIRTHLSCGFIRIRVRDTMHRINVFVHFDTRGKLINNDVTKNDNTA